MDNNKIKAEEARHAEKYGIVSGIMVVTAILFIVTVDMVAIGRRKVSRSRRIRTLKKT